MSSKLAQSGKKSANLNSKQKMGWNQSRALEDNQPESYKVLWQALYDNSYAALEAALEKDASSINSKGTGYLEGETPLIFSANTGRTSFARLLLRFGAELSWLDKHGKTALQIAQEKDHEDIITELTNYQKKLDALPATAKIYDIIVLSADGLKAADSNGKSDPYVKAFWDSDKKNKAKSPVISKTLAPEWNWKVDLPPLDEKTNELMLDLYDWDKIGRHEHLGRAVIPVDTLKSLYPGPTSFSLQLGPKDPKKKTAKKMSGAMKLKIQATLKEKLKPQLHFGRSLQESINRSEQDGHQHLIFKALDFLYKPEALNSEGIIRIPGGKNDIYKLKDGFDDGRNVSFDDEDPMVVAGLLKLFFYELPDSVFPQSCFLESRNISFENPANMNENLQKLKEIIQKMPETNHKIFSLLISYFIKLSNNSSVNKMDPRAISISIGPTLLIAPDIREDPAQFMAATKVGPILMQTMIAHSDFLGLSTEANEAVPPPPSDAPTEAPPSLVTPPPPSDAPDTLPPPIETPLVPPIDEPPSFPPPTDV